MNIENKPTNRQEIEEVVKRTPGKSYYLFRWKTNGDPGKLHEREVKLTRREAQVVIYFAVVGGTEKACSEFWATSKSNVADTMYVLRTKLRKEEIPCDGQQLILSLHTALLVNHPFVRLLRKYSPVSF